MDRKNLNTVVQRALTASLGLSLMVSSVAKAGDLDLTATTANITVSTADLQGQPSVNIQSDTGVTTNIAPNATVTPAQFVAVMQVATAAGNPAAQTLFYNQLGSASQGHFETALLAPSGNFGALVIPANVIAVANSGSLNLSGNLTTAGTVFGFQPVNNAGFGLAANNINVLQTGSISTFAPASIAGLYSQGVNINLYMNSATDIINAGCISTGGNLSMIAGGMINNTVTGSIASGLGASFLANAGIINNQGTITAFNGNINFSTVASKDLVIGNVYGLIDAVNGNINIRNGYTGTRDTNVLGGTLLANVINLGAGDGNITANVEEILGLVNIQACGAHVSTETGDLELNNVVLAGDPIFVAMDGALSIENFISTTNGEALTMLASEEIYLASGVNLNTASASSNGGNLTLVAGFNIVAVDSNSDHINDQYNLAGPSVTGGDIWAPGSRIITASGNGNGGSVTLIAHGGDDYDGVVNIGQFLSGPTIKTVSFANGAGGAVTIFAQDSIVLPIPGLEVAGPMGPGPVNVLVTEPQAFNVSFSPTGVLLAGGDFTTTSTISGSGGTTTGPIVMLPPLKTPIVDLIFNYGSTGGIANQGTPTGTSGTVISTDQQNMNISLPHKQPPGGTTSTSGGTGTAGGDGGAKPPIGSGTTTIGGSAGSAGPSGSGTTANGTGGPQGDDGPMPNGVKPGPNNSGAHNSGQVAQGDQPDGPVVHNLVSGEGSQSNGGSSSNSNNRNTAVVQASTNSLRAVGNVAIDRAAESGMVNVTQNQLRMTLVTRSNQILSGNLGGRGNFMMASEGSTYTNRQGMVVLHSGRLHASAGPDGAMIMANGQRVSVAPNTSAVINVNTRGVVSVAQVGGNDAGVSLSSQDGAAVALNPGDLVHVSDDLSSDELIDANGQIEPVSAGITHFGGQKKMLKQTVAVERYLEEELLPASRSMNLGTSARAGRNRFLSNVAAAARRQNPSYTVPSEISSVSGAPKNGQVGTIDLYSAEGSKFQRTSDSSMNLLSGMVMLRAPGTTTVQTDFARVTAERGALVAVEQNEGVTRVRALSGPGDTIVTAGDKTVQLNPGEELMLSAHALKKHDTNPADGIGRRMAKQFRVAGFYASLSDFSIASFIQGDQHVRDFISQGDNMFEGLLKTAVAVEIVTSPRGRYSSTPKATASLPQSDEGQVLLSQVNGHK